MAVTLDFAADPPVISVTFLDFNGNRATTTHYPPAGVLHADAVTSAAQLATDLDAVSTAEIEKVTISYEGTNTSALAQAAIPPASNVKDKLRLAFSSTNRRASYSVEVPSPSTAAEQEGTDVADRTEVALAGLVDEILNGPWGAVNGSRTAANFDLNSLIRAVYTVRVREPKA